MIDNWFQNLVLIYMVLIAYLIPDEPADIEEKIQREDYIVKELMMKSKKKETKAIKIDRSQSIVDQLDHALQQLKST